MQGACRKPASPFTGYPWSPTWRVRSGRSDTLFGEEPALGALIVFSEGMIDLLMQVLQQRGKAVPADISVVAVGWGELTKHVVPAH